MLALDPDRTSRYDDSLRRFSPPSGDDRDTCVTGHGLMSMRPTGPDLRLVTSVVGGEVVKRVGFVLFGGQAVLPGGVQAGVPHEHAPGNAHLPATGRVECRLCSSITGD